MGPNSAKALLVAFALLATTACGTTSGAESATRISSETTQVRVEDLNGGTRSSDQQVAGSGTDAEDRAWATPTAMLAAMGAPVEVTVPEGVTVSSVSTYLTRDESRREKLQVSIETSAELSPVEMICLLAEQPPTPTGPRSSENGAVCEHREMDVLLATMHGVATAPLPTYDSFYDWSSPVTTIELVEEGGTPTVAITTMTTRRQIQDAGDTITPTDLAAPVRELVELIPESFPTTSQLTWRPDAPDRVSANVSMGHLPERGDDVLDWMRARATPNTYTGDGETASATLTGEPPVEMTWRRGSNRGAIQLSFDYALDPNGQPMANPAIATEPVWTELIGWSSQWRFDADGVEDAGWTAPNFDDSSWQTGTAPLGRDEPDTTPFATPEPGTTGWLRSSFQVDDPSAIQRLDLEALIDDGFVVYLNGTEIHRWNLPADALDASTLAIERISGDDELTVRRQTDLPIDALVAGENVIAVAVHQAAPDSSDIRFDLRLAASRPIDL